jgi:hypothetical protein
MNKRFDSNGLWTQFYPPKLLQRPGNLQTLFRAFKTPILRSEGAGEDSLWWIQNYYVFGFESQELKK